MTPQSQIQSLFTGQAGQSSPESPPTETSPGSDLGGQLQQIQILAALIARSHPAAASSMRGIIQLTQEAANSVAGQGGSSTAGAGGGMTAGPMTANY